MILTYDELKGVIAQGYDTIPMISRHIMGVENKVGIRDMDCRTYREVQQYKKNLNRRLNNMERKGMIERDGLKQDISGKYVIKWRATA